ncbi:MAG: class I SAM-dependent DNA methyltransferase [Byssovorax sp.]
MPRALAAFIERWLPSGGSERVNKGAFLRELCLVLDVPQPDPASGHPARDRYVIERSVRIPKPDGRVTTGFIDLYKEGCFIFVVKQLSGKEPWKGSQAMRADEVGNMAMERALTQALQLAEALEPHPPFLIVCDIGRCFDLYACFDGTSRYRPFPNAEKKRLLFKDLASYAGTLRILWTDPFLLDPSKRVERVSEHAATALATIADDLELAGHPSREVSSFLLRCVFTMFAEDVGLLERGMFSRALEDHWIPSPATFRAGVEGLWRAMNDGSSFGLGGKLLRFNGGLFANPSALLLTEGQLHRLLEAARYDWSDVDPAILGTLIERPLNTNARRQSGARYTPRALVERLVRPTVEEPLRADWSVVRAEMWLHRAHGKPDAARKALRDFQSRLTRVRVLDPACGTGSFLCVALNFLQQIDSEVVAELRALGEMQEPKKRVSPAQLLGIDVNPRAQAITELMLWMGHLNFCYRAHGKLEALPEPVLLNLHNIESRDAVLAWDAVDLVRDATGKPVKRWDGKTMKQSPVTGELSPDERALVTIEQYVNPRKSEWPDADFIVGNPPFMGSRRMPLSLGDEHVTGDEYVAALRATYADLPEQADYCMYWWDRAAHLAREGAIRRFGFIIPNSGSLRTFGRRVFARHLDAQSRPLRIVYSIPDCPYGNTAILVAMTVAQRASDAESSRAVLGLIDKPTGDSVSFRDVARIGADLRAGASVEEAQPLKANSLLCSRGVWLHGSGFVLESDDHPEGEFTGNPVTALPIVRPYLRGRDVAGRATNARVIDLYGLECDQAARLAPALFDRIAQRVRPARETSRRASERSHWWRFGSDAALWRAACAGLERYIATSEIAKHRVFVFLDGIVLPDTTVSTVALDDAHYLGVLSSRVHVVWALASGIKLADSSRYSKTDCFDPFPFPACTGLQKRSIRELGEDLDAHRKSRLFTHPSLTLTGMYNVLSKLRSGVVLNEADRVIHQEGLVSVLKQIHDDLDMAVFDAYGWPADLTDEQILEKLVALNLERADEERNGLVRWLRPNFQSAASAGTYAPNQPPITDMHEEDKNAELSTPVSVAQVAWPKTMGEQIVAVRDLVTASKQLWSAAEIAATFKGAKRKAIAEILDVLTALGVLVTCDETEKVQRWALARRAAM